MNEKELVRILESNGQNISLENLLGIPKECIVFEIGELKIIAKAIMDKIREEEHKQTIIYPEDRTPDKYIY